MPDSFSLIESALAELDTCNDTDSLTRLLARQVQSLGFERHTYLLATSSHYTQSTFVSSTYPKDWCDYYRDERYINIDPIVRHISTRITPFEWAPIIKPALPKGTQKRMMAEAADVGVLVGGTVPLRGPGEAVAALSVSTFDNADSFSQLWKERQHALHVFSNYFHERLMPHLGQEKVSPTYSLAPREAECLVWTARGKSAWAIGEMLNISQRTVEEHLRNACARLSVQSKVQAVVVAIMNRLIVP